MLYILYLTSHNSSDVFIKLDPNPKCSRYIHIYIYIYIYIKLGTHKVVIIYLEWPNMK